MALSQQEKLRLTQTSLAAVQNTITTGAGLGALGGGVVTLAFLPVGLGLYASLARIRAPKLPSLPSILKPLPLLRKRGLTPRVSSSPFTGNVVISTADQERFLPELVLNAEFPQIYAPVREVLGKQALAERQAAIAEGQRLGAGLSYSPELRGGVYRETAGSPLQFVEGNFL